MLKLDLIHWLYAAAGVIALQAATILVLVC